ncbi:polygalacturonase 1 beta-like protein 3 [Diospyros lotus]|uniref:polygalacturonase 1 beta-like protein 3 n=1 Tax=Diospyros lotus TaxID=55363 RepID=UPI002256333E|nr:polygalacturonase 1 beta-like protein 3 [Diospyros lotus]
MHKLEQMNRLFLQCLCFYLLSSFNVGIAGSGKDSGIGTAGENPFTPKAYLIRYWKKHISNGLPEPDLFLLNKASPMSAVELATFSKLADQNALSAHLQSFCSSAKLLCFPDASPSLESHSQDADFAVYENRNFTNYGTGRLGGVDSFKNYSDGQNIPVDSFRRYSRDSSGHDDKFANYAPDGNVVDQSFNTYGTTATSGSGEFKNYNHFVNDPNLGFNSYSDAGNGRQQSFSSYTEDANAGAESFTSYGKNGNGAGNGFGGYGQNSNVISSSFRAYGETANGANDEFTSYGGDGNVPENNFKNYGEGGNAGTDTFKNYRDQSNVGDDSFESYAKNSNSAKVNFVNYGKSFNEGTDKFSGYGQGALGQTVGFRTYGVNNTFKDYAKKGVSFAGYINGSSAELAAMAKSGKAVNRWVEPGKFFREAMLKTGTVMPMPDIRDKMPRRSFLPRQISAKLPFSTSRLSELKKIFSAGDDSTMASILEEALSECERAPSRGETKRCVGSAEDMIDFAVSVLGRNVVVKTTRNTDGSRRDVMIGSVKGINGGKVTQSVSCHQSLFPYLLYYCHSVPTVRVYQADLLDLESKAKINHGVAICHLDTSAWSAGHGAFLALGSGPGKIEVCHWIFENDMTWTMAD